MTCGDRLLGLFMFALTWVPLLAAIYFVPVLIVVVFLSIYWQRQSRLFTQITLGCVWWHWGFITSLRYAHSYTRDLGALWTEFYFPDCVRRRWSLEYAPPDIVALGFLISLGFGSMLIVFIAMNPILALGDALVASMRIMPDASLRALDIDPGFMSVLRFSLKEGVVGLQPWLSLFFTAGCPGALDKAGKESVLFRNGAPAPKTYYCGYPEDIAVMVVEPSRPLIVKPNLGAAGQEIISFQSTGHGHIPNEIVTRMSKDHEYLLQKRIVGSLESRAHSFRAVTFYNKSNDCEVLSVEMLVAVNGEDHSNSPWCQNRLLYARGCALPDHSELDTVVSAGVRQAVKDGSLLEVAKYAAELHRKDSYLCECLILAWDFLQTPDGPVFFEFNCPCYLNEFMRRMQSTALAPLWNFWVDTVEPEMVVRTRRPQVTRSADFRILKNVGRIEQNKNKHSGPNTLCILVHGVMGSHRDWKQWIKTLEDKFPTWVIMPLRSLQWGSRFLGQGIEVLSEKAAIEIAKYVKSMQKCAGNGEVTLNFIGHSMGGLIIRGCLPQLLNEFGGSVKLGHYMSLSTPHLGGQPAPGASLFHQWKHLSLLTSKFSSQAVQLGIEDESMSCEKCGYWRTTALDPSRFAGPNKPFSLKPGSDCDRCGGKLRKRDHLLVEMAEGEYIKALRQFKTRTCVAMMCKDGAVHPSAGLIRRDNVEPPDTQGGKKDSFWGFADVSGVPDGTSFAKGVQENQNRKEYEWGPASGPQDLGPLRQAVKENMVVDMYVCGHKGCSHVQERRPFFDTFLCHRMLCERCNTRHSAWNKADEGDRNRSMEDGLMNDVKWERSSDGSLYYPSRILTGLNTLHWQRIPVYYHLRHHWTVRKLRQEAKHDVFHTGHMFLMGKRSGQMAEEYNMSWQCIQRLTDILKD
eukprot:TRINITY_DN19984_c0_g1_i1.p1 TRINITY_DN19984_c0_g1~~TRINITY_DN19984_c0_g1_i1.p1  ORF type:complete len:912 (+),score=133.29 TRINITY_DN19984_c0_g1_i1:79-2814(+)